MKTTKKWLETANMFENWRNSNIKTLSKGGMSHNEIAALFGIGRTTVLFFWKLVKFGNVNQALLDHKFKMMR
jgi:hypothetical protein